MSRVPTVSESSPPAAFPVPAAGTWMLDPAVTFLNHGCFGARLRAVYEAQRARRERFEERPVFVLDRHRDELIDEAKAVLGGFLGMKPRDFGFVTNATDGVNAVLRSLEFAPGDEILTTNHVYNAVRQTMHYLARRAGATMIEVDLPCPCGSEDVVVETIAARLTDRTRLAVLDHVTSPTAMRLPIERLINLCEERGVDVLVDGAHAPGMLDLEVERLGAAYFTGNLHKWVCAPPGAAFLWVRPDRQKPIHPTVISHFLDEGLAAEFTWQGTRDITPWLTVPDAIRVMDEIDGPGSWPRVRRHNHELATWAQSTLCAAWGVEPNTSADGSMLGSMTAITLPDDLRKRFDTPESLHDRLYDGFSIETPVFEWGDRWVIRPSCQIYNRAEDYDRLAECVLELMD